MLITLEAKIKGSSGRVRKRLDALGFIFPTYFCKIHKKEKVKKGVGIIVPVWYLANNSDYSIKYVCDYCGKIMKTQWKYYYKNYSKGLLFDMCQKCCVKSRSGKGSPNYKGVHLNRKNDGKVISWREQIFLRDKYTCQRCGIKNGLGKTIRLEAHHKKEYSKYYNLRYNLENGITLCRECHLKTHKEMRYK